MISLFKYIEEKHYQLKSDKIYHKFYINVNFYLRGELPLTD